MAKQLIPPGNKETTKSERHAFWREAIDFYRYSNLSRREFCAQHGLKLDDFRRWYYRLNHTKAARPTHSSTQEHALTAGTSEGLPGQRSFVEIKIDPTVSQSQAHSQQAAAINSSFEEPCLHLLLRNGMKLLIPNDFNQQTLLRFMQTIGDLSC